MGPYMALWGDDRGGDLPRGICPYADPRDAQYPGAECPIQSGRSYAVEMIVACGLDVPLGPFGGRYWDVVNPPDVPVAGSPLPGMSIDMDYGTIKLRDGGTLEYRSERGAVLVLEPASDPKPADRTCPRPEPY
jgi:hypothetical protein